MMDVPTKRNGPLASYVTSFAEELSGAGYKRRAAWRHLRLLGDLDDWLAEECLAPAELTSDHVAEFLRSRRARGHQELVTPFGFRALSEHLVRLGVIPEPARPVPSGPFAAPLRRYHDYLANERGLSEGTIERCVRTARAFSRQVGEGDQVDWERVGPAEVTGFLVAECRRGPGARRGASLGAQVVPPLRAAGGLDEPAACPSGPLGGCMELERSAGAAPARAGPPPYRQL